jgi:hypothetical protein
MALSALSVIFPTTAECEPAVQKETASVNSTLAAPYSLL